MTVFALLWPIGQSRYNSPLNHFARLALLSLNLSVLILSSVLFGRIAFAAEFPITVTSGNTSREYESTQQKEVAQYNVKVKSYRLLIDAFLKCKAAGKIPIISISQEEALCTRQEFQPRGSSRGTCTFSGKTTCVSSQLFKMTDAERLGSNVLSVLDGKRKLVHPEDKSEADFSDLVERMRE